MRKRSLDSIDRHLVSWMKRNGHFVERWALALVFVWFGLLKVVGETSATSIIAKSVYWFEPGIVVPMLGWWEIATGLFLVLPRMQRTAVFLLFVRLPGTFLAFVYHYPECFEQSIWVPTIQGQYLVKELTLVGAALIIGSTVREEEMPDPSEMNPKV